MRNVWFLRKGKRFFGQSGGSFFLGSSAQSGPTTEKEVKCAAAALQYLSHDSMNDAITIAQSHMWSCLFVAWYGTVWRCFHMQTMLPDRLIDSNAEWHGAWQFELPFTEANQYVLVWVMNQKTYICNITSVECEVRVEFEFEFEFEWNSSLSLNLSLNGRWVWFEFEFDLHVSCHPGRSRWRSSCSTASIAHQAAKRDAFKHCEIVQCLLNHECFMRIQTHGQTCGRVCVASV